MTTKTKLFALLAWLQLLVSLALAMAIVWGYITYEASLGRFIHSVADSIAAVSEVVGRTAETVEARQGLLDEIGQTLGTTRNLIKELRAVVEDQARIAPQYADGIRAASSLTGKLSGTLQSIGDGMLFSVPTIHREGMRPVFGKLRPLETQAQALKANAQEMKVVSESLLGISATISRDSQNLSSAFIATSEHALKLLEETERTLAGLKTKDLPEALANLRATSEHLRSIGGQVDFAGNVGLVLLMVGLLLAVWCFLSSLGALVLANVRIVGASSRANAEVER